MFVQQISIYMENIKGALNEVMSLLGDNGVDIMALSVADTASFGILRIIAREQDVYKAMEALREAGMVAKTNNVLCVCCEDKPKGLADVLDMIQLAGVSIEYMYTLNQKFGDYAVLVFRPSEKRKTYKALNEQGVKILTQEEINAL